MSIAFCEGAETCWKVQRPKSIVSIAHLGFTAAHLQKSEWRTAFFAYCREDHDLVDSLPLRVTHNREKKKISPENTKLGSALQSYKRINSFDFSNLFDAANFV